MGATKQDNGSTSEGVIQDGVATGNDQPTGTPAESPSPEQPVDGLDSGAFTKVDRATLTPEMQAMYDNMNADYTQSKQTLAEQGRTLDTKRDFTAIGELVENNPVFNRLVWDEIARQKGEGAAPGGAAAAPAAAPAAVPADVTNMSEEEQAGRAMISEEVLKVVTPLVNQINQLMGPVGKMSAYMSENQASTEYQLLVQKYPAAATIRPHELQSKQLQYSRPGGGSISIEEAFVLMAGDNPALLTAKPNETPTGGEPPVAGRAGRTGVTGVERGGAGTGGAEPTGSFAPNTSGYQNLKAAAAKLVADGTGSIENAMQRAMTKFDTNHPNTL